MRSSALDNSLMPFETYQNPSPVLSLDNSPRSEESEQQDTMMEQHDPGQGPSSGDLQYKCSICDFTTTNRVEIFQHLTEHIVSKSSNNNQEVVNMAMTQLRHLQAVEGNSLSSRDDQELNNSNNDNGNNNNNCTKEPGMRMPRVTSQGKIKTFPCKNCDFKAVTKLEYWGHIRVHIKPGKLMSCYKCPFVTEYKHHLEYHLLNHTGAKPYKCPKCPYTCVNMSMLNSHMKSHSNVYQYRCNDCKYATKYCHTLKQHLRKHRHQPAAVLNADGTQSPVVIDVYGTRRGPKQRPKNSNAPADDSRGPPAEESGTTTAATQTLLNNGSNGSGSNNGSSNTQQSTSTSPQTSSSTPAPFTLGMLANIFHGRKNGNLPAQDSQVTVQNMTHYPLQYHQQLFATLNMATQQLMPNGGLVFGEPTTPSPAASSDEEERRTIMTTPGKSIADKAAEFLQGCLTNNLPVGREEKRLEEELNARDVPLDLTSASLRNELPCQQVPLNLAHSPKATGTRRRKGVAVKLEHRVVEKEDTDEEMTQSGKRLCQSSSPKAGSASFTTSSTPSPKAASAPFTSSSPDDFAGPARKREEAYGCLSSGDYYLCPHCNIKYTDEVYVAHMNYHGRVDPFTCNICRKSYGNKSKFQLHIYKQWCASLTGSGSAQGPGAPGIRYVHEGCERERK
ncbi:PREDICTED: protein hunchback-like [Dinoponera quadriceps]|uniref:Protein hunchback n=1 Tax=Dinoponera quadriceps TaxID=609295 RepID=A0A6P3XW08_DINQU|nr:PREDICTED: protein hunchback-like [Dinoponera quadriceps]